MKRIVKNKACIKDNSRMILSDKIIGDDGMNGKYRRRKINKDGSNFQVINYINKNYRSFCEPIISNNSKYRLIDKGKHNEWER